MNKYELKILIERKNKLLKKLDAINIKITELQTQKTKNMQKQSPININNFVKIKGFNNYYINTDGEIYSMASNKIIKEVISNSGYSLVCLWENGKKKNFLVHRLVALTFLPNIQNLPEVNHKDFNKQNNKLTNLEWCSRQYNLDYSLNAGRYNFDFSKKKINQYDLKGNLIRQWQSINEASKTLNICSSHITKCCKGKQNKAKGFVWRYA